MATYALSHMSRLRGGPFFLVNFEIQNYLATESVNPSVAAITVKLSKETQEDWFDKVEERPDDIVLFITLQEHRREYIRTPGGGS